ncbi:single-strand DNA-binding protein [Raineyella antarctica]|uniref:Single-stranded DNA-binding protein n=1 Tax=Raineyella antarctica TaxID=1577474 RepID=A0A1G6H2Z0_9ACTN|nr:single-stranded DNA-binding protein [Raineyella antarctica]SDB88513.1 single-strand DNA-binding protein [Raineyella antarctica]
MDTIITLTGNLGADPRIRTVGPAQIPVTEFNIAHTPRLRQGEDWKDGVTTWYRVTCWRRLAENVVGSLRRGDSIIVTGRLRPTEWIDKQGVVQRSDEVDAITVGPDLSRSRAYVMRNRNGARPDERLAEGEERAGEETEPGAEEFADLERIEGREDEGLGEREGLEEQELGVEEMGPGDAEAYERAVA